MNMQLELISFTSEERRSRLLAEAAQWRLLKASQAEPVAPTGRVAVWLRQRITRTWRWLTQSLTNQRTPKQFIQKYNP